MLVLLSLLVGCLEVCAQHMYVGSISDGKTADPFYLWIHWTRPAREHMYWGFFFPLNHSARDRGLRVASIHDTSPD